MGEFAAEGGDLEERYEVLDRVGKGMYGEVCRAVRRSSGEMVAIKRLIFEDDELFDGVPPSVIREICLLNDFKHPNVVRLLEVHVSDQAQYCLVFEFVDQDLHKVMNGYWQAREFIPLPTVRSYAWDILNGVAACHVRKIIHRDLKPGNILVSPEGLKICDFGIARLFEPQVRAYSHDVVTLWYRAPEILLGASVYGPQVDMWSAGCCVSEILTLRSLFPGNSEIDTIFKIFHLLGTPTEETYPGLSSLQFWRPTYPQWPPTNFESIRAKRGDLMQDPDFGENYMDLLRGLLCMNPQDRLQAKRAKAHPLFNDLGEK